MNILEGNEGHAEGEEQIVYRYNREERISRAPQNVQDYYNGNMNLQKKGLFRTLVSTRGNRVMLLTVGILAVFVWIYGALQKQESGKIAGSKVQINAFSYEEDVYTSVKINDNKNSNSEIPVTVRFTALEKSDVPCDSAEVSDLYRGKELVLRVKFRDYDIASVVAEITAGKETLELKAEVKR